MYTPPFTISSRAVNLISEISRQTERYAIRMEHEDGVRLRKENRIRTIHSSLAIEGNNLSRGEVATLLNGESVVAPIRDITEVKNAIRVYDAFDSFDPFSVDDLLRAHGMMMQALTDDAGHFRSGGVGVFAGDKVIHMAPPASRVPLLISDLFEWLRESDDHLLIRSCVFHYEFEFIHPFSDGNGRMGRLWQSLILRRFHPIFAHLPVENMVFRHQSEYYDAIARSDAASDSGPFIDFMLAIILLTLKEHQGAAIDDPLNGTVNGTLNGTVNGVLKLIQENPYITYEELSEALGKSRRTIARAIKSLIDKGYIRRVGPDKGGKWELVKNGARKE